MPNSVDTRLDPWMEESSLTPINMRMMQNGVLRTLSTRFPVVSAKPTP